MTMDKYRAAESKTDSKLMSLVRSPASLVIIVALLVAAFVAGALIF